MTTNKSIMKFGFEQLRNTKQIIMFGIVTMKGEEEVKVRMEDGWIGTKLKD